MPWNITSLNTGLGIHPSRGWASVKVPVRDPFGRDLDCGRSWLILPDSVLRHFCNWWLQFYAGHTAGNSVLAARLFNITDL